MTHTPEEIIDKLGQLQPDEIARLFRDEGVSGQLRMITACPVARYVERETGVAISVGRRTWGSLKNAAECRDLPPTVDEFAMRFDDLQYADLLA